MSSIQIEKDIVMMPINKIKPYVRNPRKNDKTVELLCKVIPKVGFNVPLVIDKNGVIVKGHARYTSAIRLGMTELPCIITHASEDAIKADRIADNKISEFSEWVNDELMHEIDMIDFDIDFSELGITTMKFDDIPSFDDYAEETVSDEERKRLYQEFLEKLEKENDVQITTEDKLRKAEQNQRAVEAPTRYYKCVCEKCGHIMFVREGDLVEK